MRRKVLQDFANLFCQQIIDLPSGYLLAAFAHHGSGTYKANILTGECTFNGKPIPALRTCEDYREWLTKQLEKHGIESSGIKEVLLRVVVKVDDVKVRSSYGHQFAEAHFAFDCRSEIRTDEKSYQGQMACEKDWGFDWYYMRLYGNLPSTWPPALNETISMAVEILRSGANLEDVAVFRKLVEQGVERREAARLVEFLPMVYCRLILANSGLRFPDTYQRTLPDGTFSTLAQLASEPLWNYAIAFATAEIKSGKKGRDLLLIAGRSAEFDAANKLLNEGAKPKDIRFDAPTLRWPESGPD